ncbi:hypothetical protein CLOP_g145 [Closterium sp. NIES-67]|nr:hypothetical protein CLOP_g145 [Closterium sp. NIES-67]
MTMRFAIWQLVRQLSLAVPVVLTVHDNIASMCGVDGHSMSPTFNPLRDKSGLLFRAALSDRVLLDRLSARYMQYQRGDVVVLRSPTDPDLCLIKRLIALQDDWVTVPGGCDDVSGSGSSTSRGDDVIRRIPKGHCWVEGDNADVSEDSKHFGPVPIALLEGRVRCIVWPPHRIGTVESRLPEGRVLPF